MSFGSPFFITAQGLGAERGPVRSTAGSFGSSTIDQISRIELVEDGEVVAVDRPNATKRTWSVTRSPTPGGHFYYVRVMQADGDRLWSAPIWVKVAR